MEIIGIATSIASRTKRDIPSTYDKVKVLKTFESDVFSSAKLETDAENIDTLLALPEVVAAWPNLRVHLLAPINTRQVAVNQSEADTYAVHWATGVANLHDQGMFGEGAKVGIMDTGVVAGGYDFVRDNWVAGSARNPDGDPLDQSGHGHHVAGIVAGELDSGWVGVAPKSTIYSYKVFGAGDGTYEDIIIEAMSKAFDDGIDVITISIGGRGGWANSV
ncbi:peptidase S8/S53 domain-containing protein [Dactylonectria macrodidyma]|uniref:Peptidase S8/S53 domain-containing protein n=1 Tax=Dactylonectria macrodidyma TaxID=307937 RepID=A0A9P9FF06_9HYPO|nr:peptidase S8/S53 domain-containing protein [Dactylonectria macrodidyma]